MNSVELARNAVENAKSRLKATMRDRNASEQEKSIAKEALGRARAVVCEAIAAAEAGLAAAQRRARIASMSEADYQRWRQDVLGRMDHIEQSPMLTGFRLAPSSGSQTTACQQIMDGMLAELNAVDALRRSGQQPTPFVRYVDGYLMATDESRREQEDAESDAEREAVRAAADADPAAR